MNNHNIRFGLTNPVEYNKSDHNFSSIVNPSHNRSDTNLIRPIPKKVDLSRMIYQQFVDPYPKQSQSDLLELTETVSRNNAQNTIGNRLNEFFHQLQNPNLPFNNSRISYNQLLLANNNRNQSDFFKSQYYPNSINLPPSVLATNIDPYLYSNMNHQIPLRHNQLSNMVYMPSKESEEKSRNKEFYEEIKSNNKIQYFPKTPLSDDLIESHFSMSLNSHMKIDFKSKESLITTKQERITRKPIKQQHKPEIENPTKALKRARKSKVTVDNFDRSQEISHTLCATPSDSSISPNSMVSCRSTVTPQSIYPSNFSTTTLLMNSQNSNNQLSVTNKKITNSSLSFHKSSSSNLSSYNDGNKLQPSIYESQFQGLPLKKRIKWQIEDNSDESNELCKDNEERKTDDKALYKNQQVTQSIDTDKRSNDMKKNHSPLDISEYPLKTFQKTFLPMEKRSNSSDTDSDDENNNDVVINYKYQFSLKDQNDLLSVDNNI